MSTAFTTPIPTYYPEVTDWCTFHERLQQFFELNNIPDQRKQPILLAAINECAYKALRDICYPAAPATKTYTELIDTLTSLFFAVRRSVFVQRNRFYAAKQANDETLIKWSDRVQTLALNCRFGHRCETVLCDKFITGLCETKAKQKLLECNEPITLQQALRIAVNCVEC